MGKMGRPRLPKEKKKVPIVMFFRKEEADIIKRAARENGWPLTEAVRHYFQQQMVAKFYPKLVNDPKA